MFNFNAIWEKFIFISKTLDFMEYVSSLGFSFIIISNQAGVGKKIMNNSDLNNIHKKMIKEFMKKRIKILDIYVCIHHPDQACNCRKPKPGMFFNASNDHSFNLKDTFYIGDDERDAMASKNSIS